MPLFFFIKSVPFNSGWKKMITIQNLIHLIIREDQKAQRL